MSILEEKLRKPSSMGSLGRLTGSRWNPTRVVLRLPTEPTHAFKMWIFTGRFGKYQSPKGSLPCDVDFHQGYVLIGCLHELRAYLGALLCGRQGWKHALGGQSKKDFDLELTHIHNAAWKPVFNEKGQLEKLYA